MSLRAVIVSSFAFALMAPVFAQIATVPAVVETPPVGMAGDAADDPAIRVGATPETTRILGTQKKGGLYVYDLAGAVVQSFDAGRPNNIDLREDFPWTDGSGPIVAVSDRSDNAVVFYKYDTLNNQLFSQARTRLPSKFAEVYGITLGRIGADFVVAATSKAGDVAQWTITPAADGGVAAVETRRFALGSIAEGMAIDDALGILYVAQELVGLWRMPADPASPVARSLVDTAGPGGKLAADVEGVDIYQRADGTGYLIVSAQGESRFNVYDRAGSNAYRGTFRVGPSADGKADGVTTTDGLAVTSAPQGAAFPHGLLVVQDDLNTDPATTQDFKYASWAEVAKALALDTK